MEKIITETLAEIYLQQGHLQEAYEILKALSEKDPTNIRIQTKLNELGQKLNHASHSVVQPASSTDEKIRLLKRWLCNIQERRRG